MNYSQNHRKTWILLLIKQTEIKNIVLFENLNSTDSGVLVIVDVTKNVEFAQ